MGASIVLGFHSCVDFELQWDQKKFEDLIKSYHISDGELTLDLPVDSQENMVRILLAYMKQGRGAEFTPSTSSLCFDFSKHFHYKITVGGTATRAAIALGQLGYPTALSMVCCNRYIKERLPKEIQYYANTGEASEEVYPHVVFTYPGGAHIQANDIDFITPRENRILFSKDRNSANMVISQGFAPYLLQARVMLISCFSEVMEEEILQKRMEEVNQLLTHLPPRAFVIFEDGCYIQKPFQKAVHKALRKRLDALSMNEDEMQDYIQERIDLSHPPSVAAALASIYRQLQVPLLIVHSSRWAIAYGKQASRMTEALQGGIALASTRFMYGDDYGQAEYQQTALLPEREDSISFCKELETLLPDCIAVPSKDLQFVKSPVVVGLGDCFAGGLLPALEKFAEKEGEMRES